MAEDTAQESHGIFQFHIDDDIFEQGPQRNRHHIDWSYKPKETTDGWMLFTLEQDIQLAFDRKLGPNEVLNAVEWLYLKRKYQDCIDACDKWLKANASQKRPFKVTEIGIIAARSCIKQERYEDAAHYMSLVEDERDPGIQFFRAEVLMKVGRYTESLKWFLEYLHLRKNDYMAWKKMAHVFEMIEPRMKNHQAARYARELQKKCLSKCLFFLEKMDRPQSEFSDAHTVTEINPIKEKLVTLTTASTTTTSSCSFQDPSQLELAASLLGISLPLLQDIVSLLSVGQSPVADEDDERRVDDL